MLAQFSHNWRIVALRGAVAVLFGVFAVLFGVFALVRPRLTLELLVQLIGIYALVDGAVVIVTGFTNRAGQDRWLVLWLEGLVGVAAGAVILLRPGLATFLLRGVIAFWAIATGALEVVSAIRLRREVPGEWMLALSRIVSLVLGAVLLLYPAAGALAVAWLIGWYAILFGAMILGLSLRLRHPPYLGPVAASQRAIKPS